MCSFYCYILTLLIFRILPDYSSLFTVFKTMSWFPFIPQKVIICFLFSKFQYEFIDLSIFSVFQSIEITILFVIQIVPFFFFFFANGSFFYVNLESLTAFLLSWNRM